MRALNCTPFGTPIQSLQSFRSQLRPRSISSAWVTVYQKAQACQAYQGYATQEESRVEIDGRARLSGFWAPSGGIAKSESGDTSHSKLIRSGYLRQAHSGIFHMLPLGLRVQDKLEKLIDKYMSKLGASRVDLSSISSEGLWNRSGRLNAIGSELFRFQDRKNAAYLLSPTHEEEITNLVACSVKSYKDLPLRLYQISRKYRDELRPRHGLLRSREFVMKDLYTFDLTNSTALSTYNEVRQIYARLFDELKIPYLVAEADSGDMGGNLSHEFHFPTPKGEDHIISCTSCSYVANEELAESPTLKDQSSVGERSIEETRRYLKCRHAISRDRATLVKVWYFSSARDVEINKYAVKNLFPDLDSSVEDPASLFLNQTGGKSIINIVDGSVRRNDLADYWDLFPRMDDAKALFDVSILDLDPATKKPLNLLRIKTGDACPNCADGIVKVQEAIELGHTFHLGNRYSKPLEAHLQVPIENLKGQEADFDILGQEHNDTTYRISMQMGCHGIGVSRIIGAVADTLADEKGLNWPRVMAPFEAVVIAAPQHNAAAVDVYDTLVSSEGQSPIDAVLDDRLEERFAWKMHDADQVGYPVIIILGKRWEEKVCEVQCRRLKVTTDVPFEELPRYVNGLLEKL